jgi:hypothetical protein
MTANQYIKPLDQEAPIFNDNIEDTDKNGAEKVSLTSATAADVTVPAKAKKVEMVWASGGPVVFRFKSTNQTSAASVTADEFRGVLTEGASFLARGLSQQGDDKTTAISLYADGTDSVVYVTFE